MVLKTKIKEIIVVEGRSDSAKLKSFLDCDTIETSGSALDEKTLDYIEKMSQGRGVIVFTDPDFPGMQIRQKVSNRIPNCKHAFVPKKDAIAHGKVGIAEAKKEAIIEALNQATTFMENNESITWQEFISLDIIGNKDRRLEIYDLFHLGYGNAKTLFKRLNMANITKEDILKVLNNSY